MWQRDEAGTMKWNAALSHCEGLSLANHTDWRLPNIKELEALTDDTLYNPALNRTFFPGAVAGRYWSSTSGGGYIENVLVWPLAWAVEFSSGSVDSWVKPNYDLNVRCVRGQSGDFARLMRGGNTVGPFKSLQDAYDAALSGDSILARAQVYAENLTASDNKNIALSGGYDFDFISNNGVTTLSGVLTVGDGVFTVGNLVIR
jgi:hypothetical protein